MGREDKEEMNDKRRGIDQDIKMVCKKRKECENEEAEGEDRGVREKGKGGEGGDVAVLLRLPTS